MEKTLGVGLIGYGYAGRTFHAPVIASVPGLRLAAVVQRSGDSVLEKYPSARIYRDTEALYADPSIGLVVVTTPSTDHYSFAKAALLAGKHVVVEKPFTAAAAEADELIALARGRGLVLSVFHNRRWDGDFLTVKQLVSQGVLGRLTDAEFRWERFSPVADPGRWRNAGGPGSGVFYDLGIHFLDQALSLFGTPRTISADIRTVREGALSDDAFDVTLGYGNGLRVALRSMLLARQPGPRYTLHGTGGSFVKFGEDPQENALKAGQLPGTPGWGAEPESGWGTLETEAGGLRFSGKVRTLPGNYQEYYRNVAGAIAGTAELAVKPEEARIAVRLVELGLQSAREGRTLEVAP
ncbi:oxidoreductase [Paenibacillus sp. N4]|uniref:oxidoreductase n=1 Tax=Paenibacillus vietnamensis TaxID=2590547 RepID=UPI001CD12792|nr:oxidoreductase [Paenibacillus vietnamensis]MCA0757704.1 oxidoreductase [Paenibacillus vietnamensis]